MQSSIIASRFVAKPSMYSQMRTASLAAGKIAIGSFSMALIPEAHRSFYHQDLDTGFAANTIASLTTLPRRAAGLARTLLSQAANDYEATVASDAHRVYLA
ncbi:MAG: hypothetical protein JSS31_11730 [Proteobacteria bacterium]|nr:hypothetical protein [Pseudomonadota bacterium]MBS0494601.1 hypothetical protein [Pseudomonadota bacterium]